MARKKTATHKNGDDLGQRGDTCKTATRINKLVKKDNLINYGIISYNNN